MSTANMIIRYSAIMLVQTKPINESARIKYETFYADYYWVLQYRLYHSSVFCSLGLDFVILRSREMAYVKNV